MTTKEQERKALEQIRKIVEGLGEGSYIGTAFEGCFEDAEENIENDFGLSMKNRWENAEKKKNEALEGKAKFAELAMSMEQSSHKYHENWEASEARCADIEEQLHDSEKQLFDVTLEVEGLNKQLDEAHNLIHERDFEIITLKAKLYDLMMAK